MIDLVYNNKQENYKYKSWIFTWNSTNSGFLIREPELRSILEAIAEEYVFQKEFVSRVHYQGYLKLTNRVRKKTLLNMMRSKGTQYPSDTWDNLTVQNIRGTDKEAIAYVTKSETRIGDPIYSTTIQPYVQRDLAILQNEDNWHPWQKSLSSLLETHKGEIRLPDDRTIIWIYDWEGNAGKSKFLKMLCVNYPQDAIKLPFGSPNQIRSSVCAAGPKRIYFLDLPRSMKQDNMDFHAIFDVIEDIKNGFVTTSMYGQYKTLMFEPPHIVVFANAPCPVGLLSKDRWQSYELRSLLLNKLNI